MNRLALAQKLLTWQTDTNEQLQAFITDDYDDLAQITYYTKVARDISKTQQQLFWATRPSRFPEQRITGVQGFEKYITLLQWLERLTQSPVITQQPHLNALHNASEALLADHDLSHWQQLQGEQALNLVDDLNVCIANYRVAVNQPKFKEQSNNRARNQRERTKEMHAWIKRLFVRHSKLLLIRLDTGFNDGIKPHLTAEGLTAYREQLIQHIQNEYPSLVGYLWKLEWMPIKGFHFHWLLVFNAQKVRKDRVIARNIGEHWKDQIVQGNGVYYNCNANTAAYEHNAIGMVKRDDNIKRSHFKLVIKYLTKLDDYVRYQLPKGMRAFGKSEVK